MENIDFNRKITNNIHKAVFTRISDLHFKQSLKNVNQKKTYIDNPNTPWLMAISNQSL